MSPLRVGKFKISDAFIRCDPEAVAKILAAIKFVPTRVEHFYLSGEFEYIGISERFDECSGPLPEYELCIIGSAEAEPIEVNVTRKSTSIGNMHEAVPGLVPDFYGNVVSNSSPAEDGIVVTIPDEPQAETDY